MKYLPIKSIAFFLAILAILLALADKHNYLFAKEVEGWYAHRTSPSSIILTPQEILPDIGATETMAYGRQISVSKFDRNILYHGDTFVYLDLNDTPMIPYSKTGTWGKYSYVIADIDYSGTSRVYYIIGDRKAYSFYLYPLFNGNGIDTEGLDDLEQIMQYYFSEISLEALHDE